MWRGVVVFAITYALVASRRLQIVRVDRPAGALVGAVLAVALGAVTAEQAAHAVDQTTIVLLFAVIGMGAFVSVPMRPAGIATCRRRIFFFSSP